MRIKLLLASTSLLLVFAFASCGGDDKADNVTGDESAATTSPTSDGNAAAPSGEAVRAAKVEIVDFAYDPIR